MSSWIFGKPNEKEQRRKDERQMRTAGRELATDLRQLDQKEKELQAEIRKLAKSGQKEACAVLAKQLVQLRKQRVKNVNTGALVSSISTKNRTMQSMNTMAGVLGNTTKTMQTVNAQVPLEKFAKDMNEFSKQHTMMDMREEVMNEALDSMLDVDEGEEDRVINQVLDEIGIETNEKLSKVPRINEPISGAKEPVELSDKDIEKMLAQLRS